MSSATVRTALQDALGDVLGVNVPVVLIENLDDTALPVDTDGLPTLFVGLLYFATEQLVAIGDPDARLWREIGTADVVIYGPAGRGIDGVLTVADQVRAAFGGRDIALGTTAQRLTITRADPLSSYFNPAGQPTGAYYVGMVALAYEFDFFR